MASRPPGPVLVTGANSGIGLATVLELARRGWSVHGTVRSARKAEALLAEARRRKLGAKVHAIELDVSDHDAVVARWPELPAFHAVVNNAGTTEAGAVEEVPAARAKALLDVNLVAPAVIAACALPAMRRRGAGRIVMVSSLAGRAAVMPLNGWYHASKFGLEALSDILRVEVAAFGVQVVIVEPGFFRTGILDAAKSEVERGAAHAGSPYREAYRRQERWTGWIERVAPDPKTVARTIANAIEARRPRRRYVVGVDALALLATEPFTPREVTDLLMRASSGLFSARREKKPD